ncbi:MAG TPA: hypothetical protein VLG50_06055 [Candidatus Saccharimonadales bacterium]|nr:hypothetical protein [Candidatus Saccharimonadales bacterium]
MFYILLSAALFLIPFFNVAFSIPCSFIFLIPLIVKSNQQELTFLSGLMWGLCVFAIHCSWFLCMIFTKEIQVSAICLWIGTIGWLSVFSGIWFMMTRYSWTFSTLCFFLFVMYGCMIPLGQCDGYPFLSPLIPLCYYPKFLWCLKYLGTFIVLSCLILFQVCLVQKKIISSFLFLLPFLIGPFFYQEKIISTPMHYLKPWWYGDKNPMFVGYRMAYDIREAMMSRPDIACILMPESTFCFDVVEYEQFISLWSDPDDDTIIMFGGHRCIDGKNFNSCMCLQEGKIVYYYDKQHLIPFFETVPKICNMLGWEKLGISTNDRLHTPSCSKNNTDIFELYGQKYQIFICSELFFQAKPVKGFPIILIWNESWLCCEYMKNLAVLFIKYFEIKNDVPVLYASTGGRNNIQKP